MSILAIRLGNGKYGLIELDYANKLLNNNVTDTEEMREDNPNSFSNSYSYKGIAANGSSTSSAVWSVLRIQYDNNGNPVRYQVQNNISWDSRASGW